MEEFVLLLVCTAIGAIIGAICIPFVAVAWFLAIAIGALIGAIIGTIPWLIFFMDF